MKNSALRAIRYSLASLIMLFQLAQAAPVFAGTNTCTWTGAGGNANFSTAANWSCDTGTVPADGFNLVFPRAGATNYSAVDDLASSTTFTSIVFSGSTGSSCGGVTNYDISGNDFLLAGDITTTVTGTCTTYASFHDNITLSSDALIQGNSVSQISMNGTLALGSHNLSLQTADNFGNVSGTGNVTITNSNYSSYFYGTNTFSGTLTVASGVVDAGINSFGTTAGGTIVQNSASLTLCVSFNTSTSTAEPFTLNGAASTSPAAPKLASAQCGMGGSYGGSVTEDYESYQLNATYITLSGAITLGASATYGAGVETTTLTGALSGSGMTLTPATGYGGSLIINSSPNTAATSNGTYQTPVVVTTLSDSQPSSTVAVVGRNKVLVNGVRSNIIVAEGGILGGSGTVGNIDSTGGIIAPGNSPGCLNTGNLNYDSATHVQEELGGTTVCTQYDQTNVTGTVTLGSAVLDVSLYNGWAPSVGQTYTIINNDGSDAISGTFSGLAQGATFVASGVTYTISYTGGDGNDVVLTVTSVPAPPATGIGSILRPTILLPLLAIASGAIIGGYRLSHRSKYYSI